MKRVIYDDRTLEKIMDLMTNNPMRGFCNYAVRKRCTGKRGRRNEPLCLESCRRVVVEITEKKEGK